MPKKPTDKLFTISEVAEVVEMHRSEVTGILVGLQIVPRKAGNALVVTHGELQKVQEAVARSRQVQPA